MPKRVKETLIAEVNGTLFFDEPLFKHTSFRIGGPADVLVIPKGLADLRKTLELAKENSIVLIAIGNGTKLLVGDLGVEGITVRVSGCMNEVAISEQTVQAGAGLSLSALSWLVADQGLSGLEFAVGIPGTVGGAVAMNAGAHGASMSDVVKKVIVLEFEGAIREYDVDEIDFSNRQSRFQNGNSIILKCELFLNEETASEVRNRMNKNLSWRKENQPLDFPNAGSIFRNPEGFIAGKLIDYCGLKGMKIGDAQISQKRANFIINLGNAKASEVRRLMEIAQTRVFEKYGVQLEPEIRVIGKF